MVWQPLPAKSDVAAWRTTFAPIFTSFSHRVVVLDLLPQRHECPLWVISRRFTTAFRMSAFGGKADVVQGVDEGPLLARSGHKTRRLARALYALQLFLFTILGNTPTIDLDYPIGAEQRWTAFLGSG